VSASDLLQEQLRREIADRGAISFARFMEVALYAPGLGYYERAHPVIGRQGDFYTSVSVGRLFGDLLAMQFAGWADLHFRPVSHGASGLQLVEGGAHDGRLAADILRWVTAHRLALCSDLQYWIIEPSSARRSRQRENLAGFASAVQWATEWTQIPPADFRIVFSNELLDALPVHRVGWNAATRQWFEWGVRWEGGRFVWCILAPEPGSDPSSRPGGLRNVPSNLLEVLPDGYTVEVCPAAPKWWRTAAAALSRGILLTLDYGLTDEERFKPGREAGTLRACRQHRVSKDLLANPGDQDLTAHVDFSALQAAGEGAGLTTVALSSQEQFLTTIAAKAWADPASFGAWTPECTRQFQTLTHPQHLGRAFRVLVQSRGLWGAHLGVR
jgi:SAM-dependent MidA family methyltransferase